MDREEEGVVKVQRWGKREEPSLERSEAVVASDSDRDRDQG